MRALIRLYDRLVDLLAIVAALMLVWLMVATILSVTIRNLGLQPSAWFFTSSEYALLYITMLGAPWLVRKRGHVHIELLTAALPPRPRAIVSRTVAALSALTCAILAWKGVELVATNIARSDYDVRAFFVPRWYLTLAFPIGFGLMAVEFCRFVFGREIMHTGEAGIHEEA